MFFQQGLEFNPCERFTNAGGKLELPGEAPRAVYGVHGLREIPRSLFVLIFAYRAIDITENAPEKVVEVVGDPSGKNTKGIHPLNILQRLFDVFSFMMASIRVISDF
jgi:hypothetical protein